MTRPQLPECIYDGCRLAPIWEHAMVCMEHGYGESQYVCWIHRERSKAEARVAIAQALENGGGCTLELAEVAL